MHIYYSGDNIDEDHIDTDITTRNAEERNISSVFELLVTYYWGLWGLNMFYMFSSLSRKLPVGNTDVFFCSGCYSFYSVSPHVCFQWVLFPLLTFLCGIFNAKQNTECLMNRHRTKCEGWSTACPLIISLLEIPMRHVCLGFSLLLSVLFIALSVIYVFLGCLNFS